MTAAGIATSVIVAIMVIASITLLPAFLGLSGHWINRLGIHRRSGIGGEVGVGWQRWGRHVTGHAWPYAIGVTLLLVAFAARRLPRCGSGSPTRAPAAVAHRTASRTTWSPTASGPA